MYCPNCGAELKDDAQKCYVCGCQLDNSYENNDSIESTGDRICPVCGTILEQDDSVCPICGIELEHPTDNNKPSKEILPENALKKSNVPNHTHSKSKLIGIIIGTICLIVIIVLLFTFKDKLFSPKANDTLNKKSNTEQNIDSGNEESTNDSATTPDTAQEKGIENTIDFNTYIGYWNITGKQDRELTIQNISDKTVTFSLWYYRLDAVDNITATLNGNTADFVSNADSLTFKGTLTFDNNSISVNITDSERYYMPVESMKFSEKHTLSWELDSGYSDAYTGTDNNTTDNSDFNYNSSASYILPDSSSRELTIADITGLSHDQLDLARNEIYARHGRKFTNPTLQNYFNSQAWYTGTIEPEDFTDDMLSDIEKNNIQFIKEHE